MFKNKMVLVGLVIVIAVLAFVVLGRGDNTQESTESNGESMTDEAMVDSSVAVSSQAVGSSLTIDSAVFVKPGYIVIHEQVDGAPGPVIGNSVLYTADTYENVSVDLGRESVSGETLYAMLHDDDGDSEYVFPGADEPTVDSAGDVVLMPVEIQ